MISSNNLTFLTNNVKGLQSFKKRIKLTEYFKSKLNHSGFLFLQETHLTIKMKIHGSMLLMDRFSFLMEHLILAVFRLLT